MATIPRDATVEQFPGPPRRVTMSRQGKRMAVILTIIMAIGLAICGPVMWVKHYRFAHLVAHHESVQGSVIATHANIGTRTRSYFVDYFALTPKGSISSSQEVSKPEMDSMHAGDPVEVIYDPDNISDSHLGPVGDGDVRASLIGVTITGVIGFGLIGYVLIGVWTSVKSRLWLAKDGEALDANYTVEKVSDTRSRVVYRFETRSGGARTIERTYSGKLPARLNPAGGRAVVLWLEDEPKLAMPWSECLAVDVEG
jgi:hypothetical protein